MRVGFYNAGYLDVHRMMAQRLIASVRASMPGVPIVHFTDQYTPPVDIEIETVRETDDELRGLFALATLEAFANCEGDWLFVDTDVEIRSDVSAVFDREFDIAIATREGTLLDKEVGTKFMATMPYNKGVVFSRSPMFWLETVTWLRGHSRQRQVFMGDQQAVNAVISTGRYRVEVLPNRFNYPPKAKNEDVRDKSILHFKGPRKQWALAGCFA